MEGFKTYVGFLVMCEKNWSNLTFSLKASKAVKFMSPQDDDDDYDDDDDDDDDDDENIVGGCAFKVLTVKIKRTKLDKIRKEIQTKSSENLS